MSIGIWQLVLILLIVFVIFGAGKLPRVMGDIGKGVRSLKDGLKGEEKQASNYKPTILPDESSAEKSDSEKS